MRLNLKKLNGERLVIYAKVEKFGTKINYKGFPERTILLIDLKCENNRHLTDHIWFTVGKTIDKINLSSGDCIKFMARVKPYIKGYFKDEVDYKLSNISKIERINT